MGFDFKSSPNIGDVSNGYTWDGEKWTMTPPAVGAVRYDTAQALTSDTLPATMGQRAQARSNIFAAPFDSLAFNGLQVNGGMDVSQELSTNGILPTSGGRYALDGFVGVLAGSGGVAGLMYQAAIGSLAGYPNAVGFNCTAPNPLSAAGDGQYVYTPVEGCRWARLGYGTNNAQPVTIAFWSNSTIGGTMAVSVRNSALNRTYVTDVPVTGGGLGNTRP